MEHAVIDISTLSLIELADLNKQIDFEIVNRKETEKQNLCTEIQRMAANAGMPLNKILSGLEKKPRKQANAGIAQFRKFCNVWQVIDYCDR